MTIAQIKSTFGLTREPFTQTLPALLEQQQNILDIIKIHAQHGGFSVIIGQPGVGKSTVLTHLHALAEEKHTVVASFSRTMHTYPRILAQLTEAFKLEVARDAVERELIQVAYRHIQERKTLYTLIDEAHLMDMQVLRKLRLLLDSFPKKHNLVLFGQHELLYHLSMTVNEDLKSRITYSAHLQPLNDQDLAQFIERELTHVKLGANTYDDGALELILRSVQGNLRLCRNLCYGSLLEACRDGQRAVSIRHVNAVLIQPHWRSHEDLIKHQVA